MVFFNLVKAGSAFQCLAEPEEWSYICLYSNDIILIADFDSVRVQETSKSS